MEFLRNTPLRAVGLGIVLSAALVACVDSRLRDAVRSTEPGGGPGAGESLDPGDPGSGEYTPPPVTGSPAALFQTQEILPLELEGDFSLLLNPKGRTGQLSPGTLAVDESGARVVLAVRYAARPERFARARCRQLPLEIELPRDRAGTPFQNLKSSTVTLVLPCRRSRYLSEDARDAQELFAEYGAHRMLSALGNPHSRTRLAQLTLRDRRGRIVSETFGFVQEPSLDLGARHRMAPVPASELDEFLKELEPRYRLIPEIAARLALLEKDAPVEAFRSSARGSAVALALPELFSSALRSDGGCGAAWCWKDQEFLHALWARENPDPVRWKGAVLRELRRVSTLRGAVSDAIASVGPLREARHQRRVDAFFESLERFLHLHRDE